MESKTDMIVRMNNGETFTNSEMEAEIQRLRKLQDRMVGSLYPAIIDSEISKLRTAIISE